METTLTLLIKGDSSGAVSAIQQVTNALGNTSGTKQNQKEKEVLTERQRLRKEYAEKQRRLDVEAERDELQASNRSIERRRKLNAAKQRELEKELKMEEAAAAKHAALEEEILREDDKIRHRQWQAEQVAIEKRRQQAATSLKIAKESFAKEQAALLAEYEKGQEKLGQARLRANAQSRQDLLEAESKSLAAFKVSKNRWVTEKLQQIEADVKLGKMSEEQSISHYKRLLEIDELYASKRLAVANKLAQASKSVLMQSPMLGPQALPPGPNRRQFLTVEAQRLQAYKQAGQTTAEYGRAASYGASMPIAALAAISAREYANFEKSIGEVAASVELGQGSSGGQALRKKLGDLVKRLGTSSIGLPLGDISGLALQGAQAGVGADSLESYIKSLYELKLLIPEMPTEELAEKFNKLMVASGKDLSKASAQLRKEIGQLATIGAMSAAGPREVLSASTRVSGTVANAGGSTTLAYALSGAGTGSGIRPEEYSTQVNNFIGGIHRAKMSLRQNGGDSVLEVLSGLMYGGKNFTRGTVEQQRRLVKELNTDADNTILNILGKLRSLQGAKGNIYDVLKPLGVTGRRGERTFITLGNAPGERTPQQYYEAAQKMSDKTVEQVLADRAGEALKKYQVIVNKFVQAAIELADGVLPAADDIIKMVKTFADTLIELAQAFGKLPENERKGWIQFFAAVAAFGPAVTVIGNMVSGFANLAIVINKFDQLQGSVAALRGAMTAANLIDGAQLAENTTKLSGLMDVLGKLKGIGTFTITVGIALAGAEGLTRLINFLGGTNYATLSEAVQEGLKAKEETDAANAALAKGSGHKYNDKLVAARQALNALKTGNLSEYEAKAGYGENSLSVIQRTFGLRSAIPRTMIQELESRNIPFYKRQAQLEAQAASGRGVKMPGFGWIGSSGGAGIFGLSGNDGEPENFTDKDATVGARAKGSAKNRLDEANAALYRAQEALATAMGSLEFHHKKTGGAPSTIATELTLGLAEAVRNRRTAVARAQAGLAVATNMDKFGQPILPGKTGAILESELAQASLQNKKEQLDIDEKLLAMKQSVLDNTVKELQLSKESLEEKIKGLKQQLESSTDQVEKAFIIGQIASTEIEIAKKQLYIDQNAAKKAGDKGVMAGIASSRFGNTIAGIELGKRNQLDDLFNAGVRAEIDALENKRKLQEEGTDAHTALTNQINALTDTLRKRTQAEITGEAAARELARRQGEAARLTADAERFATEAGDFDPSDTTWLSLRRSARSARRGALLDKPLELSRYNTQAEREDRDDTLTAGTASLMKMIQSAALGSGSMSGFGGGVADLMRLPAKDSDRAALLKTLGGGLGEGLNASVGLFGAKAPLGVSQYLALMLKLRGQTEDPVAINDLNQMIGSSLKSSVGAGITGLQNLRPRQRRGALDAMEAGLTSMSGWLSLPETLRDEFRKTFEAARKELVDPVRQGIRAFDGSVKDAVSGTGRGLLGAIFDPQYSQETDPTGYGPMKRGARRRNTAWDEQWQSIAKTLKTSLATGIWDAGIQPSLDAFTDRFGGVLTGFLTRWQGTIAEFGIYANGLSALLGMQGKKKQRSSLLGSVLGFALGSVIPGLGNMAGAAIGGALATGGIGAGLATYGGLQLGNIQPPGIGNGSGQGLLTGNQSVPLLKRGVATGGPVYITQNIERIGKDDAGWYNEGLVGTLERVSVSGR